jgi:hypothetical protein
MAVYVDDCRLPFGLMSMCHMFAIPEDDPMLTVIALRIGLRAAWFHRHHYNLCQSKRLLAIREGAISVTAREGGLLRLMHKRTESA